MKPGLLATTAALLLSGCNLAPRYTVPVIATPVSYKEAAAWSPAAPADSRPKGAWWAVYADPVLNGLESHIDSSNADLAGATAAFDRARAFAAEAEAGLYPELTLGSQVTTNRQSARRPLRSANQPNQYMDNSLDVQATYEIDFWDKRANSIRAGRAAAQASAADLATLRLALHAELASDYLTLRGLDAQSALLRQTVASYSQAAALTRNRFEGLIASGMDVSRAATQLNDAQAQVTDIAARRALIEHAIALLVGEPPAALTLPPAPGPTHVPIIAESVPAALLQRRPDIASAERQMFAANAEIGVASAAFYPNITLNAVLGLGSSGLDPFSLRDGFWTLGPGLALPLFEGGRRRAEENAATAAYRLAAAQYRQIVLNAFAEVEDQLALLHWLGEEQHQVDSASANAQKTLDMSMNLYRAGATNYLDVVTAQTSALATERASIDLRARRLQASVALIRALGGGWSDAALAATPQPVQGVPGAAG